jgi:hypothetical protein
MTTPDSDTPPATHVLDVAGLRRRLHDANGQLSNAVLQLSLVLEDASLDDSRRADVEAALEACRRAAGSLREIWPLLTPPP